MIRMKRFFPFSLFCLCVSLTVQAQRVGSVHNDEISRSLDIFNAAYRDLDLYYVDTLSATETVEGALEYMLQSLDPFTTYYAPSEKTELDQMTTGKYAGIGASLTYHKQSRRCVISELYEGQPAFNAGLLVGDEILSIDGKNLPACAAGSGQQEQTSYASEIAEMLRGVPGTSLLLKIKRPPRGSILTYKIQRQSIALPSVSLATLAADSVGYICLTQFVQGTSDEVRRAMVELKQRGARQLILDLRDNPGGLLEEAVKTVNLFIPHGRMVVSMRGKVKEMNYTYRTTIEPQDPDIPLIILVNEQSASASEITSGVLQDYDRALILGKRTYGKGLVQQSRQMPGGGVLKLTTARYYIPSGRCVQAYRFKDGKPIHQEEDESKTYRTAAGRIVYGGGGIAPDVEVDADSIPLVVERLAKSAELFDYVVNFRATHPSIASPSEFELSSDEYADFCEYIQHSSFQYDSQSARLLDKLRTVSEREGYDTPETAQLIAQLESKIKGQAFPVDLTRHERLVRRVLEEAIIEDFYARSGRTEYLLRSDPQVKRALQLFAQPQQMHKLLTGEPDA